MKKTLSGLLALVIGMSFVLTPLSVTAFSSITPVEGFETQGAADGVSLTAQKGKAVNYGTVVMKNNESHNGETMRFWESGTPLVGEGSLRLKVPYTKTQLKEWDTAHIFTNPLPVRAAETGQTGIALRLKAEDLPDSVEGNTPALHIRVTQNGKTYFTGNGAALLSKVSGAVTQNANTQLIPIPAAFDGCVFLPLSRLYSTDTWGVKDEYKIDTLQPFTVSIYLCSTKGYSDNSSGVIWGGATLLVDALSYYSGTDYEEMAKEMDPAITGAQPAAYPLPIRFDEGYTPFTLTQIDKIDTPPGYENHSGQVAYTTQSPLHGTTSVRFDITGGTIRSETNAVNMKGIPGFSTVSFESATGLFLRVRLTEDQANTTAHLFQIFARQRGVSGGTILANGAVVFDSKGNLLDVKADINTGLYLPANFDGFVFLPFSAARSETVTEPGKYDQYATHPQNMVDFSKEYTMQLKFGDASWVDTVAVMDDISVYQGDNYAEILKGFGYEVNPPRPADVFAFPLSFEDGLKPFTLTEIYHIEEDPGYAMQAGRVDYISQNALNGSGSMAFSIARSDIRSETNAVKMEGVEGFSKSDFSTHTGIFLRMKIEETGTAEHEFDILCRQAGLNPATLLCAGAVVFNSKGEPLDAASGVEGVRLPAGFDGFVFLPFASARSEKVTEPGKYDHYGTYPDSMVDFAKDYTLQLQFKGGSYMGASITLDDIAIYTGEDYPAFIESLGYELSGSRQPDRYSFPITFDEGYTPFTLTEFFKIEEAPGYASQAGAANYIAQSPLHGTMSVAFPIEKGDIRSDTNAVKMAGIEGFSKSDFTQTTGIFVRVKILEGQRVDGKAHNFKVYCRQDGLAQGTVFCAGASVYDLHGERVAVSSNAESLMLPADFDGFVFLPFASAHSEKVTEPGKYDQYDTYPDSMVDFSKDYTMLLQFVGDSWPGATAVLDDLYVYSGGDHLDFLKNIGYDITAVQQPDVYTLPLDFDGGMKPFDTKLDAGIDASTGLLGTGGTLSYVTDGALSDGVAMKWEIPDVTAQQSVYTSRARVKAPEADSATGIVMRIKTTVKKSASLSITMDWMRGGPHLGSGSLLFDKAGDPVDHPRDNAIYFGSSLPDSFDGYVFFPFNKAIFDGDKPYLQNHPEWKFGEEHTFQIFFNGDKQVSDSTTIIDCVSLYTGSNYQKIIESLGYKLEAGGEADDAEIVGEAGGKFFYTPAFSDHFDGEASDLTRKWELLDEDGYRKNNLTMDGSSLSLHYRDENQAITSGAVRMAEPCSYGYYEAKIRFPSLPNAQNAMKLVTAGHYTEGGVAWQVDAASCNRAFQLKTDYHYMKNSLPLSMGGQEVSALSVNTGSAFVGEYHVYGVLYTYNYIRYYVDGALFREEVNTFARGNAYLEISGDALGDVYEDQKNGIHVWDDLFTQSIDVDYVRYWSVDFAEMMDYDTLPEELEPQDPIAPEDTNTTPGQGGSIATQPTTTDEGGGTVKRIIRRRKKAQAGEEEQTGGEAGWPTYMGFLIGGAAVLLAALDAGGIFLVARKGKGKKEEGEANG